MMMRLFLVVALCFSMCSGQAFGSEAAEKKAVAASDAWLQLVDAGTYEQSWDDAAALFRNAVSRAQWQQSAKAARGPLGRMLTRKLASKTYATSLPGAPDGEYVVIQYRTSFEHKKNAVETVTPMRDRDGQWRVSGYYIK